MTLHDCILYCAGKPELVAEFDRLSGTHLSTMGQRSAINAMVDEATGRDAEALAKFSAFVAEVIWWPVFGAATLGEEPRDEP